MLGNQELPSSLWPLRDAIIAHVHGNARKPRSLKKFHDWLEGDGWDTLIGNASDEHMALNLLGLAQQHFSDSEFRGVEGLDPEDVITDAMRLAHAREMIAQACTDCDEDLCPMLHTYKVERFDGATAFVGASVEMDGHDAVAVWQGIYATRDDFLAQMKSGDLWRIEEAPEIDDARLLAMWERDV